MEQEQFEDIVKKLDLIAKLISLSLVKDEKTLTDKVKILNASGFKPKEIATLLDKKPNHIRQILHQLRKKENSSRSKRGRQNEQRRQND